MLTAYDFTMKGNEDGSGDSFGIANVAKQLRDLADRIERDEIFVQKVRVVTDASSADFARTYVRLTLHECVPIAKDIPAAGSWKVDPAVALDQPIAPATAVCKLVDSSFPDLPTVNSLHLGPPYTADAFGGVVELNEILRQDWEREQRVPDFIVVKDIKAFTAACSGYTTAPGDQITMYIAPFTRGKGIIAIPVLEEGATVPHYFAGPRELFK